MNLCISGRYREQCDGNGAREKSWCNELQNLMPLATDIYSGNVFALGLLANLKETRKVKWAGQVEATSITSVVTSLSAMDSRDRPLKN